MASKGQFCLALQNARGIPFKSRCSRIVSLEKYHKAAKPTLLFDAGPKTSANGQRFSPPGHHRGLYVGLDLLTAGSEFADGVKNWNIGPNEAVVTLPIHADLKSVLDLTSVTTRRHLGITLREVKSSWLGYAKLFGQWPVTWELGCDVFDSKRFDGILFPSTRNPGGKNLLVFTERLKAIQSSAIIYRDDDTVWERLP
jgi:RES domain-containing protein